MQVKDMIQTTGFPPLCSVYFTETITMESKLHIYFDSSSGSWVTDQSMTKKSIFTNAASTSKVPLPMYITKWNKIDHKKLKSKVIIVSCAHLILSVCIFVFWSHTYSISKNGCLCKSTNNTVSTVVMLFKYLLYLLCAIWLRVLKRNKQRFLIFG